MVSEYMKYNHLEWPMVGKVLYYTGEPFNDRILGTYPLLNNYDLVDKVIVIDSFIDSGGNHGYICGMGGKVGRLYLCDEDVIRYFISLDKLRQCKIKVILE